MSSWFYTFLILLFSLHVGLSLSTPHNTWCTTKNSRQFKLPQCPYKSYPGTPPILSAVTCIWHIPSLLPPTLPTSWCLVPSHWVRSGGWGFTVKASCKKKSLAQFLRDRRPWKSVYFLPGKRRITEPWTAAPRHIHAIVTYPHISKANQKGDPIWMQFLLMGCICSNLPLPCKYFLQWN